MGTNTLGAGLAFTTSSRFADRIPLMLVFALVVSLAGCSDHQKRTWRGQSPEENFQKALEAKSGDERRDAVARIAESGYVTRDDAFAVLDTAARTDPASQVRCIALRAFTRYDDGRPVTTVLAVLDPSGTATEPAALPGDEHVRWEGARTLLAFKRKGLLDASQEAAARDAFLRLMDDSSRSVKLVAIEALGECQDPRVLNPLIRVLRSNDFALADRAEESLIQLTGSTHNYDPQAWEQWLAATQDPFARAGERPPITRPAGPSWWDQQMRAWRRGLKLGRQD